MPRRRPTKRAAPRPRSVRPAWAALVALAPAPLLRPAAASDHDAFQARAPWHTAGQRYVAEGAGGGGDGGTAWRQLGTGTVPTSQETCEQVHAGGSVGPLRIGYELLDVADVPASLVALVGGTLMNRAAAYWASTLQVHRAVKPLRADRRGKGCSKYPFESEYHCQSVEAPQCGFDGLVIPDRYLRAQRTCGRRCSPQYTCRGACYDGEACHCSADAWAAQRGGYCCEVSSSQPSGLGCPSSCSAEKLVFVGSGESGGLICEGNCTDAPEGEGAVNEDLHVFVTIKDSPSCVKSGDLQAYANWCVKDQCDRPIFAAVNFCRSRLSLAEADEAAQVGTAVHELAHAMAFSSSLFRYFRAADGSPLIPRKPGNQDAFPTEVRWSCGGGTFTFPNPAGGYSHVDLAPSIVNKFSERGFSSCQCPVGGSSTMGSACFAAQTGLRLPSCVMRMLTPAVQAEARAHFGCPTLAGAELENQDTSECVVIGSHWEQRVFNGELMAPKGGTVGVTYLSRVTLALFQDSGWYEVNMSMADPLTPGVHWGYKQGCAFAEQRCLTNGVPVWGRAFCTVQNAQACSMDRTHVRRCELNALTSPPPVFDYFGSSAIGSYAEMDYCPTYRVALTNRVCASAASNYTPFNNVNMMREVFGRGSRCLESTLHADVAVGRAVYAANPDSFKEVRPVCYEVACAADGRSYEVRVANLSGGTATLGVCGAAGEELAGGGGPAPALGGGVRCAAPAEVCQLYPPIHNNVVAPGMLGATRATSTSTTTTAAPGSPSPASSTSRMPSPDSLGQSPGPPNGGYEANGARARHRGAAATAAAAVCLALRACAA